MLKFKKILPKVNVNNKFKYMLFSHLNKKCNHIWFLEDGKINKHIDVCMASSL